MWSELTPAQRVPIERIRLAAHRLSSSHCFPSLYLWREEMGISVRLEENGFLLRKESAGPDHYFFPCGTDEAKRAFLKDLPAGSVLHYADEADAAWLAASGAPCTVSPARGDWEYLCDRSAQTTLEGHRLRHLRTEVNRVREDSRFRTEQLTGQNLGDALLVERQWNETVATQTSVRDTDAANTALAQFDALSLHGVTAFWEDVPVGYAIGFCSNETMFVGALLHCLRRECYAALRHALYAGLPDSVSLLNLEEDLDLPGLRMNKTCMNPVGFLKMYDVHWKET